MSHNDNGFGYPPTDARKYQFEYEVGQWTFGKVDVLKDTSTGKSKTSRTVSKSMFAGSSRSIMKKLQSLRALQHAHICPITDVVEDSSQIQIISDWEMGGDVADWVERLDSRYEIQESACASYVRQALIGIVHCHQMGVIHRDLNPRNMMLSSKLPDATVRVSEVGLAAILDPHNKIAQKNPTVYHAPEVLGSSAYATQAADVYSIGALAHVLLVGSAPGQAPSKPASNNWLKNFVPADDGWGERSHEARDFAARLLQPADLRPTAARALQHPWLKAQVPLMASVGGSESPEDAQTKNLCYVLAVLLLPKVVPHCDFEGLHTAFARADTDKDGLINGVVATKILRTRCQYQEAVGAAMTIADIPKTNIIDLCTLAVADLIAREFFAAGPTHQPISGPFGPSDLAPRMLQRFFEAYGDGKQPPVTVAGLNAKLTTATARDVEAHAGVSYSKVLSTLPGEVPMDQKMLVTYLIAGLGYGTPLYHDTVKPVEVSTDKPWDNAKGIVEEVLNMWGSFSFRTGTALGQR